MVCGLSVVLLRLNYLPIDGRIKKVSMPTFVTICSYFLKDMNTEGWFEVLPITGGHRRMAIESPQLREKYANNPAVLSSWQFEMIDASVWNDPDCDLILRGLSFFDNFQLSSDALIKSCDCERILTVWDLVNNSKDNRYKHWQTNSKDTVALLKADMVCYLFDECCLTFNSLTTLYQSQCCRSLS